VVFGRPKGTAPPTCSGGGNLPSPRLRDLLPKNSHTEMLKKYYFYEDYGVEEYYITTRKTTNCSVICGAGMLLRSARWTARQPRLGIRFDLSGPELVVATRRRPFIPFEVLEAERERIEQRATRLRNSA